MDLTDEQKAQAALDTEALTDQLKEIVANFKSGDMDTMKILSRIGQMQAMCGFSRTNALGAIAFGAYLAPIAGLTKDQLVGLVEAIYEAVVKLPSTEWATKYYAEENQKYLQQKSSGVNEALKGFVLPGNDKVH